MAEWEIDLSEVNGLRQWYKGRPKMMQKASAMLLNRFAWGTRDESVRQIRQLMVVRNERFVSNRLRVTQTSMSTPISQQRSMAGSIAIQGHNKRGDFTGWTEQERGDAVQRKRVSTLASRSGDIHKQMIGRARLKPGNEVTRFGAGGYGNTPRGLHNGGANFGGWIALLARKKYKGLLSIKGGFYLIDKGGQRIAGPTRNGRGKLTTIPHLQLVQETKKEQPKQKHWLRIARAVYFRKNDSSVTWARTVNALITPPPKK